MQKGFEAESESSARDARGGTPPDGAASDAPPVQGAPPSEAATAVLVRDAPGSGVAQERPDGDPLELVRIRQANQQLVLTSLRALELQERLTAALDASSTGTFRWDVGTGRVEQDANFLRLCRAPRDAELAHIEDLLRLFHADDRDLLRKQGSRRPDDAGPFDADVRVVWPDHSVHWLSIAGRTCIEPDGRRIVLGACFDATERRRAEDERAQHYASLEAERRCRTLTDALPQIVWTAARDGRLEYANERFFSYTGLPRDPLAGTLADLAHPEDRDALRRASARSNENGGLEVQVRLRARDGSYRWFLVGATPAAAPGHGFFIGTCTDIEGQKRAERELEWATRAKDEFLAMLGHELRNPLAVITAAFELMKVKRTADTTRERDAIERQLHHLVRLVDELLDVSRITRGTAQLAHDVVSIQNVVADAVELTAPFLERQRHELHVNVPSGELRVRGDRTRLTQVVSNLLVNAAQYTKCGGHVNVRAFRDREDVVLDVQDDGVGISTALLPHVFDSFIQGERSLDRSEGGLGVGLTVVKQLALLHGGSAEAFSEGPGRGSLFRVRLPLLAEESPAEKATSAPADDRDGRPLRVLLVEDNLLLLETSAALLESFGYTVAKAENGPAALRVAETFHPDVALLDIGLPGMDGLALARLLREKQGPALHLIAMTGYGQESDRARTAEAGFALHLVKPVEPERLRKAIASFRGAAGVAARHLPSGD